MRKELEVILKQLSDVASKILSTEDIDLIEKELKIYENFLTQIIQICNNGLEKDENGLIQSIHLKNNEITLHLEKIKSAIKNDIKQKTVDRSIFKIFNSVEKSSLIDKKG
ncbi:MAG: hypothetical protein LDL13_04905 [Calditerrivibrio sp.]|nr:hypothetical protein [Calditerrivibrio sp.]MCA1932897.1 hypothetical protein [Calditerrivibrio sp.]MCA1979954.1 hypothetical protein [Calditerrivibrio sp.]